MYRDELVTVYCVPVYPTPTKPVEQLGPSTSLSAQTTSTKRGRSASPRSSSKRQRTDDSTDLASSLTKSTDTFKSRSLIQRMLDSAISPTSLRGEEAQEWRRLLIQFMFSFKSPSKPAESEENKNKPQVQKVADSNNIEDVGPSSSKAVAQLDPALALDEPDGSNEPKVASPNVDPMRYLRQAPLPPLLDDSTGTPYSPSNLCYVLVGPRVRGKFDAKKAAALGVGNGPLRGQLAKGNTITIEVDDGKGGRMMRTVKPEDCVGPSESPQVCFFFHAASYCELLSQVFRLCSF